MAGSVKTDIMAHFPNFNSLPFYNLHTQVCILAKFHLHILRTFQVTALQRSGNRKSTHRVSIAKTIVQVRMQLKSGVLQILEICTILFVLRC